MSRVDSAVDKLLEANGSDEAKALEGKAAVANARLAYELFEKKFAEDPRWADLAAKGAKVQRPLWASTGTKNAAYSDCKYVDELVAKHIVNTMPEKTLNALADHGNGAPIHRGTYERVPRHHQTSWLSSASTSRTSPTSWRPTVSLPSSSPGIPCWLTSSPASTA